MLPVAFSLFALRSVPFSRLDFPRWQSVLTVSVLGLLVGLDPAMRAAPPGLDAPPLWLATLVGLIVVWVSFVIVVAILRGWMKRGGRWDGRGDLFNLVAASWLVADILGAGLTALGVPALLTLPLWLYSVWVGGNALSGAIPTASLGYGIAGIVLALIPALLISGLLGAVFVLVLVGVLT